MKLLIPHDESGRGFESARAIRANLAVQVSEPQEWEQPVRLKRPLSCAPLDPDGQVGERCMLPRGVEVEGGRQGHDYAPFWVFRHRGKAYLTRECFYDATHWRTSPATLSAIVVIVVIVVGVLSLLLVHWIVSA